MSEAGRIWNHFVACPGATVDGKVAIASRHAIGGLIRVIEWRRPEKILELGAGIGTLTFTILATATRLELHRRPGFCFYTIEDHPLCLEQLARNLSRFAGLYRIVGSTEELRDAAVGFDLIVVDGGGDVPGDIKVMDFSNMLAPRGVILVEGYRLFQRKLIAQWYGDRKPIYLKSEPLRRQLHSAATSEPAENKPYHLFVFEPAGVQRLRWMAGRAWNEGLIRLLKRVRWLLRSPISSARS